MGPVRGEIQWNESARVLLIETVIQVEAKIRNNTNVKVGSKWRRINNLLPPHLRGQTWSCQRQKYNNYKCQRMFYVILKVYRGMKRHERSLGLILTKPVFEMMKKREELLQTQSSTPAKNGLKSGSPTRVSNSTGSASDQKLLSPSINEGDYSNAEIQWNEAAHILLIQAVIQVEEEIRNNPILKTSGKWDRINNLLPPHLRGRPSGWLSGRPSGWKRDYKCRRRFQNLLEVYRGKKRGRGKRLILTKHVLEILKKREDLSNTQRSTRAENSLNSGSPITVSYNIGSASGQKLLSPSINSFTNTHTNRGHSSDGQTIGNATESKEKEGENFAFFPRTASASKQCLPWTTELHESFVDAVTELGGADRATPEDLLRVMCVESLTIHQVRSHLQMYRLRYIAKSIWEGKKLHKESSEDVIASSTNAPSTNQVGHSLGHAPKSSGEFEGPENQNMPTGSTVRPTAKSVAETFQEPEKMAAQTSSPAQAQSGFETGAPGSRDCRSSTRPSFDHSPTFMSESKAHTRYDEHLHSILDEPLRRLDLEFSSLSSWVQSKLIPDGKKVMYGMTSSTIQSVKRRKLNAGTDPLDDIFHESRNRFIDLQIRASFERLKFRFAEELKNISMEVVQLVRQNIHVLYSSQYSSHDHERSGQCPSEERSMSK